MATEYVRIARADYEKLINLVKQAAVLLRMMRTFTDNLETKIKE